MMPRLCLFLITLVPCVLAQSEGDVSPGSNGVKIRVAIESNGACDVRTRVSLVRDSGPAVAEGYSNSRCVVEFFSVPAGNYHVQVSGPGIVDTDSRGFEIDTRQLQDLEVSVRVSSATRPVGSSSAMVDATALAVPASARKKLDSASRWIAKNNLPKALDELHQAIDIEPKYADAYNVLGTVYGRMGDKTQSRDALQEAIRLNDRLAPAYVNLAQIEITDHNFSEAETLLGKATAVGLDNTPTLILLASVELATQHYEQAIANCRKTHSTPQVSHASAHYIAARAYEQEHRPTDAIAELRVLLSEEQAGARADAARKEMAVLQGGSR